ncbi:OsmC family protein [Enterobacillus tribolii]|uniref:Organic hydroperoxide reductase OsmC/OhrA n=1 Tax=Enterobacillus tribolii TaxID=1487935 RepID=A0A370R1Y7_9GAMM|nr:OsmC family protein [Enterobacillus tribolii]MBW7982873.1 OsmC family peroxiredoxin [Enterobacillus tribolii]RDK95566.1 organic hydroperoxide reductase OsmC/OhrA [Enterobacillus tribolii]
MSKHLHSYQVALTWTGNRGEGTTSYKAYGREYDITGNTGKVMKGSADPQFLGDPACWNPEEMLLASLSACHQLWYLHLCADAGVRVLRYEDTPRGIMDELSGKFTEVTLAPRVVISAGSDAELAVELHHLAHKKCYIANSMNFPVQITCTDVVVQDAIT